MDIFEDIRTQFVLRARLHDDEASITLKGHLLAEYLMDQIIEWEVGGSKRSRNATFAKKLEMLEEKQLLPRETVANLKHLNTIRNKMAHELDVDVPESNMLFYREAQQRIQVRPKRGRHSQRYYLRLFCHGVLTQLTNYMLLNLKVDPRWKDGLA